jgi:Mitochondrial carrier protein
LKHNPEKEYHFEQPKGEKGQIPASVQVYREEGAKAFLRGWEPRVTWIAIGGSIFFGSLELAKSLLVPKEAQDKGLAGH